MLAAIMTCCGAVSLTSCTDDDDSTSNSQKTVEQEVTELIKSISLRSCSASFPLLLRSLSASKERRGNGDEAESEGSKTGGKQI